MIIHTPTQKNYDTLMRILDTRGYRWGDKNLMSHINVYDHHGKETCINITLKTEVMYGGREAYLSIGKAITPFTEALKILQPPMLTLENMPVGTILKDKDGDHTRILARLNEGKDSVYLLSYIHRSLNSRNLLSAWSWNTIADLVNYTIQPPPSDTIEVNGKKYALIKEVE
jgi:hypothetical protein